MGQSGRHPPKVLIGVQVWTLWWPINVWRWWMNLNQSSQFEPSESWQWHQGPPLMEEQLPPQGATGWSITSSAYLLPLMCPSRWTRENLGGPAIIHHISSWEAMVSRYPSSFLIMRWPVLNPFLVISPSLHDATNDLTNVFFTTTDFFLYLFCWTCLWCGWSKQTCYRAGAYY